MVAVLGAMEGLGFRVYCERLEVLRFNFLFKVGVRIRGTLGDIDPLNKLTFKRARSTLQKGPL